MSVRGLNLSPHRPKRARDALHRAPRQALVARQQAAERSRSEDPRQQSHRRSRIAAVEAAGGFLEAPSTLTLNLKRLQRRDLNLFVPRGTATLDGGGSLPTQEVERRSSLRGHGTELWTAYTADGTFAGVHGSRAAAAEALRPQI